jgi:hypothetical protein
MGSLAAIKRKYPHIKIIASGKDAPYVTGRKKSLRLEQAEQIQLTMPQEQHEAGKVFQDILKSVENTEVDMAEAKKSVLKLLNYYIEKIICYHGGEYQGNIPAALQNIGKMS